VRRFVRIGANPQAMSGEDDPSTGERADEVDVEELLSRVGFDPEQSVLTRRQAEVYVLRERGYRQADIAALLGTSRANVANVEASARENIRKARDTVAFADILAASTRIELEPGTDLYEIPPRVFDTCDEADVTVNHTAPELMEMVEDAASDAVQGRTIVSPIAIGVSAEGEVRVIDQ
jgi:Tfx family DNA-binding protein